MSDSITSISKALAQAQAVLEPASKDGQNPHFRSRYASLAAVNEAIKPIHKFGLSVIHQVQNGVLTTTLMHESGESFSSSLPLKIEGQTPQQLGSQISYYRRYLTMALLNLSAEDDDGNAASQVKPVAQPAIKPEFAGMAEMEKIYSAGKSKGWTEAEIQELVKHHGYDSVVGMPKDLAREIYAEVQKG